MSLHDIAFLSRKFGKDEMMVLGGGGNTSFKTEDGFLYIKPSGTTLANMYEKDFVCLNRRKVREIFNIQYKNIAEREEKLKAGLLNAVCDGSGRRPSIETPLHETMPFSLVVHLHATLVNGMTCAKHGKKACEKIFPKALWIPYTTPGMPLAQKVKSEIEKYTAEKKEAPKIIFIQNHGVFVGADNRKEIERIYSEIIKKLKDTYKRKGISTELPERESDTNVILEYAPILKGLMSVFRNEDTFVTHAGLFDCVEGPLSPDHIAHIQSFPLSGKKITEKAIENFKSLYGYLPVVISVPHKAVFCIGSTLKSASLAKKFARDGALVKQLTEAFGGVKFINEKGRKFIENWEVEAFRKKIAFSKTSFKRLQGKTAIVTGGAQGFGKAIAEGLIKEGACVGIADVNFEGAKQTADKLCSQYGNFNAFPVEVNVSDQKSVENMVKTIVELCGGIDIFISNAGVLKAGNTPEFDKNDWDFVTNVNYTGYFLCVKFVAPVMIRQNRFSNKWTDIIQINSKSGLAGSNKNAAYSGSKFGTIGLTQSFALEFVENKIKVNSICPGNFFDGPLWSDPEKGLFKQYLESGKVPGAKTIRDVKKFYESKVPMGRGCYPEDVIKAILYVIEQEYETGQAIPVTGGQIMLS